MMIILLSWIKKNIRKKRCKRLLETNLNMDFKKLKTKETNQTISWLKSPMLNGFERDLLDVDGYEQVL